MLRNNWLSLILLALLGASVLTACWSSVMWFRGARESQALEFHFQRMNDTIASVQTLAGEAFDYSRRHSSIEPILTEYNIRPRQAPAASGIPMKKP